MGKLLSLLARDDSNCCTPQKYDVFLDFENGEPSASELETYREVKEVLESAEGILNELAIYKGAGREIREAITTPTDENVAAAWVAVVPLVAKLKTFYFFSLDIQRVIPLLLNELCSGIMSPTQHLESQQALVKQFADILEFVLKFDEYKMKTPALQNDLSYYRRSVNRRGFIGSSGDDIVNSELANRMSLFFAQATPMLRALTQATDDFVKQDLFGSHETWMNEISEHWHFVTSLWSKPNFVVKNKHIPIENTTETLATMAKVCLRMLESPSLTDQFEHEETELLVLRVMVGLVILYDHIHPAGAFVRSSSVDVKGCVRLLREQAPVKSEPLLNALRYTTKHLNEDATPKQIKNLLAA